MKKIIALAALLGMGIQVKSSDVISSRAKARGVSTNQDQSVLDDLTEQKKEIALQKKADKKKARQEKTENKQAKLDAKNAAKEQTRQEVKGLTLSQKRQVRQVTPEKAAENKKEVSGKNRRRTLVKKQKNLVYDLDQLNMDKQEAFDKQAKKDAKKSSQSKMRRVKSSQPKMAKIKQKTKKAQPTTMKEKREEKRATKSDKLTVKKQEIEESTRSILTDRSGRLESKIDDLQDKKSDYVLPEGSKPQRHTRAAQRTIMAIDNAAKSRSKELDRVNDKLTRLDAQNDPKQDAVYYRAVIDQSTQKLDTLTDRRNQTLDAQNDFRTYEMKRKRDMPVEQVQGLHRELREANYHKDTPRALALKQEVGVKETPMPHFDRALRDISDQRQEVNAVKKDAITEYKRVQPLAGTPTLQEIKHEKSVNKVASQVQKKHKKLRAGQITNFQKEVKEVMVAPAA